jgi:hypothetical protein
VKNENRCALHRAAVPPIPYNAAYNTALCSTGKAVLILIELYPYRYPKKSVLYCINSGPTGLGDYDIDYPKSLMGTGRALLLLYYTGAAYNTAY